SKPINVKCGGDDEGFAGADVDIGRPRLHGKTIYLRSLWQREYIVRGDHSAISRMNSGWKAAGRLCCRK
ncbi:MAG: hypothetical protein C4325_09875, partial [Blastocatellia bacterium]